MRRLALLAVTLGLAVAVMADDSRLLDLAGQKFVFEKEGKFALVHCAEPKGEACGDFEGLAPQLDVDWAGLLAKAKGKKKAEASYVDQFGGLWTLTLSAKDKSVVPTFPGYRVTGRGSTAQVDVMGNQEQWQTARHELGLDKPKKKGLSALFE